MQIKTITHNATQDNLTDHDYHDIYNELRGHNEAERSYAISLDKFIIQISSNFSKALWSKYHNDQIELNRAMRNELRAAVGLPLLPPTVEESISGVDPDATVIQVGEDQPDRVLLVGKRGDLNIHLINGSVSTSAVTEVTSSPRLRRHLIRPVVTPEQKEKVLLLGASWKEVIDAGIQYLSNQQGSEKGDKNV